VLVGVLERMTMLEKEVLDALNTAQKHAVHPHISLTQQQGHNALAGNSELQSAVQNMRQFRQMLVMLLLQWETALKSDAVSSIADYFNLACAGAWCCSELKGLWLLLFVLRVFRNSARRCWSN
jgi:hypothetical protein